MFSETHGHTSYFSSVAEVLLSVHCNLACLFTSLFLPVSILVIHFTSSLSYLSYFFSSPLTAHFSFWPYFLSSPIIYLLFFLSLPCLDSYCSFSLALCTRLNWQFSVSFQVHIKSSCIVSRITLFYLTSPPRGTPANILLYLIFLESRIIGLNFAADKSFRWAL